MPDFEYTAQAASPSVNGEAKLTIAENSFSVTATFDTAEIPYAEINQIAFANYMVTVKTDGGDYVFSRMGEWAERFNNALCEAYNKAVLRSMFVQGKPLVTASGDYRFIETDISGQGTKAPIHVYENCVVSLPPDLGARRIPLCFVTGMDSGSRGTADEYTLTLRLASVSDGAAGESYTFSRLGYDTAPIEQAIEKQKRALLEKALQAIKEIDPAVSTAGASGLARLLQEGAAAPFSKISAISGDFAAALERKISQTRAAEYYETLKTTCDPAQIYIGFRKNEKPSDTASTPGSASDSPPGAEGAYMFWLIAPSPNGSCATVEFSEADTATFVYKTCGNFGAFAGQLNRALEAINFKREVIFIDDAELRRPENAACCMAAKRTAALQFVRRNFTGRVIHSNPDAWKRKLLEIYGNS